MNLETMYLRRLEALVEANPRSRVFYPLAEALRLSGRSDEALALLERGLAFHPEYEEAKKLQRLLTSARKALGGAAPPKRTAPPLREAEDLDGSAPSVEETIAAAASAGISWTEDEVVAESLGDEDKTISLERPTAETLRDIEAVTDTSAGDDLFDAHLTDTRGLRPDDTMRLFQVPDFIRELAAKEKEQAAATETRPAPQLDLEREVEDDPFDLDEEVAFEAEFGEIGVDLLGDSESSLDILAGAQASAARVLEALEQSDEPFVDDVWSDAVEPEARERNDEAPTATPASADLFESTGDTDMVFQKDILASPTIAELYLEQGYVDKAIGLYEQLLRENPSDQRLREGLRKAREAVRTTKIGPADEAPSAEKRALDELHTFLDGVLHVKAERGLSILG